MIPAPSRSWQRQALALRLVLAGAEQVVPSYQAAGETPPGEVVAALDCLMGRCSELAATIGPEVVMLAAPDRKQAFARRVKELKRAVERTWPGPIVPAPHLMHGTLLVVEDIAAQAPPDRRRELWMAITDSLAELLGHKGWQDGQDIEDGAKAGEALKREIW